MTIIFQIKSFEIVCFEIKLFFLYRIDAGQSFCVNWRTRVRLTSLNFRVHWSSSLEKDCPRTRTMTSRSPTTTSTASTPTPAAGARAGAATMHPEAAWCPVPADAPSYDLAHCHSYKGIFVRALQIVTKLTTCINVVNS